MDKLKRKVEKLEDVEEAFRTLYVETDDGFVLEGVEKDDRLDKLDEFRANNRTLHKQLEELKQAQEKFKDIDPEKYAEGLQALAKQEEDKDKKLIDEGKIEELIAKRTEAMRESYENKLAAKTEAFEKLKGDSKVFRELVNKQTVHDKLLEAFDSVATIKRGAKSDVLARGMQDWGVDDEGEFGLRRDVFGTDGNPIKLEEWAANLVEEAGHLFEPGKGGGAGGGNKTDSRRKRYIDANDPVAIGKNAEAIAKGEIEVR